MKPVRRSVLVALCMALLVAACGDSTSPPVVTVDLDRLFAPPTAAERAAVEADWAARSPRAQDVRVESTQPYTLAGAAMQLRIVSHVVDGNRHFGAIIAPQQAPAGPLPLLLYLHGGDAGAGVEEVGLVAASLGVSPSAFTWVVPSFRSEQLRLGAQRWNSGGTPSPWDHDVDDTLALLDVAAALVPAASRSCVASIGFSRGAGVGLLLAAREPTVRATVAFFGPTDFFGPFMREVTQEALQGRMRDLPGVRHLNQEWLQPLRRGQVTYDATRLALLRRSPAYFVERMGPVQLHHGTADDVVPVSQAEALMAAMAGIGRSAPDFEAWIYPLAGHNPFVMPAAAGRVTRFLAAVPAACAG